MLLKHLWPPSKAATLTLNMSVNQSFWAAAYALELRPGSETRARWMAAGVLEQTIDLIIEKLQDWGRIPHS